jgi:salicylate 1-O-methyltransferase
MTDSTAQAAAKPMNANYNETVYDWTKRFIEPSLAEIEKAILKMPEERFQKATEPFSVAEFGCSTGAASVSTLFTVIKVVRSRNN